MQLSSNVYNLFFDPSTVATGVALFRGSELEHVFSIKVKGAKWQDRKLGMKEALESVALNVGKVNILGLEKQIYGGSIIAAMAQIELVGMIQGVIPHDSFEVVTSGQHYKYLDVKRADKDQMIEKVLALYGPTLASIGKPEISHDEADAISIGHYIITKNMEVDQ